jgi:hypothetical protein
MAKQVTAMSEVELWLVFRAANAAGRSTARIERELDKRELAAPRS